MTITSFRIATEPLGPGKGAWFWVRIYDSPEELREAAYKLHPWTGRTYWDGTYGCVQPIPYREHYDKKTKKWICVRPKNHFRGTIRLCRPFTYEHVAHELIHAAMTAYRMDVRTNANFGPGCNDNEENFAYLTGELFDQFMRWLIEASDEK